MKTYPLTQSQLAIYWEYIRNPESIQYNSPGYFRFSRNVDTGKLKRAIHSLIEAYPIFRTRMIAQEDGQVRQYPDYDLKIEVPVVYLAEEEVERQVAQFIRPFDLQKDALSRFLLVETPLSLYFMIDIHHIITDGLSYTIMLYSIDMAYKGHALPEEQMSLYEYALQEEPTFLTPHYQQAAAYYKEKFKGVEMARFPQRNSDKGSTRLSIAFVDREPIESFCMKQGVTPNLLFMAAFEIVMSRITREEVVAYATVNHGRNNRKARSTLGLFAKTVPILMKVDESQPTIDFIKSHRQELISTIHYGVFPLTHFSQQTGCSTEVINFVFNGPDIIEYFHLLNEDVKLEQQVGHGISAEEPIFLIFKTNTDYEIRLQYVECQYEDGYMQCFVDAMVACIGQLIASPDKLLKDITIVSEI